MAPKNSDLCSLRKSTLDIIQQKEIDAALCEKLCDTGDILLYGNPLTHRSLRWYLFVKAVQGDAAKERRLPMIHVAFIVKDPPPDVLEVHGKTKADGNVFVFEATSGSPNGARLVPLRDWVAYELDPAYPDGKVLFRMRNRDKPFVPPRELWDWLKRASTIPYTPLFDSEYWFNAFLVPGSYEAMVATASDFAMDFVKEKLGTGPAATILAGLLGMVTNFLGLIGIVLNFAWYLLVGMVGLVKRNKKVRTVSGVGVVIKQTKDKDFDHMTCSRSVAKTLMKAGVLSTEVPSLLFLPKDFLPKDVGAEGNLFDDHLLQGVTYSDSLMNVVPAKEKRKSVLVNDMHSSFRKSRVTKQIHFEQEASLCLPADAKKARQSILNLQQMDTLLEEQ